MRAGVYTSRSTNVRMMDSWVAGNTTAGRARFQYRDFIEESQQGQSITPQDFNNLVGQTIKQTASMQNHFPSGMPNQACWQPETRYAQQQYGMYRQIPTKMPRMDDEFSGYANRAQSMPSSDIKGYPSYALPSNALSNMNGIPEASAGAMPASAASFYDQSFEAAPRRKQPRVVTQSAHATRSQEYVMPTPAPAQYCVDPAASRPQHFQASESAGQTWMQGMPQWMDVPGKWTRMRRRRSAHWNFAENCTSGALVTNYQQDVYAHASSSYNDWYGDSNYANYESWQMQPNGQRQINNAQGTWVSLDDAVGTFENQRSSSTSSHHPYHGSQGSASAVRRSFGNPDSVETAPRSVDSQGSQSNNGDSYAAQTPSPTRPGQGDRPMNTGHSDQGSSSGVPHVSHSHSTVGPSVSSQAPAIEQKRRSSSGDTATASQTVRSSEVTEVVQNQSAAYANSQSGGQESAPVDTLSQNALAMPPNWQKTVGTAPPQNGSPMVNFADATKVPAPPQHSNDAATRTPAIRATPGSVPPHIEPVLHQGAPSSAASQNAPYYYEAVQGNKTTFLPMPQSSTGTAITAPTGHLQSSAHPGNAHNYISSAPSHGQRLAHGQVVTQTRTSSLAPATVGQYSSLAPQRTQGSSNHGQVAIHHPVDPGSSMQLQWSGVSQNAPQTAPQNTSSRAPASFDFGSTIYTGHPGRAVSQVQAKQTPEAPQIAPCPVPVEIRGQAQPPRPAVPAKNPTPPETIPTLRTVGSVGRNNQDVASAGGRDRAVGPAVQLQTSAHPGNASNYIHAGPPQGHRPATGQVVTQMRTPSVAPATMGQYLSEAPQRMRGPSHHGEVGIKPPVAPRNSVQVQGPGLPQEVSHTAPRKSSGRAPASSDPGSIIYTGHPGRAVSQVQAKRTSEAPQIAPRPVPVESQGQTQPPTASSGSHQTSPAARAKNPTPPETIPSSRAVGSAERNDPATGRSDSRIPMPAPVEGAQQTQKLSGSSVCGGQISSSAAAHVVAPCTTGPVQASKESQPEQGERDVGLPKSTKSSVGETSVPKEPTPAASQKKPSPRTGRQNGDRAGNEVATAIEPQIATVRALKSGIGTACAVRHEIATVSSSEPEITTANRNSGPALTEPTASTLMPSNPQACNAVSGSDSQSREPKPAARQTFDLDQDVSLAEAALIDDFLRNDLIDFPNPRFQARKEASPVQRNDICVVRDETSNQSSTPPLKRSQDDQPTIVPISESTKSTSTVTVGTLSAEQSPETERLSISPSEDLSLLGEDIWEAINREAEELIFRPHQTALAEGFNAFSGIFMPYGADEAQEAALDHSVESKTDIKSSNPRASVQIQE